MKQILIILLFIPLTVSCQIRVGMGSSFRSWQNQMMRSYLELNDHIEFTKQDKVNIQNRLKESYVKNTFGPNGLDKDTCDFFLYFTNSNTSTPLTTRTITNTADSSIMWDYGDNSYYQDNLPAQVNNGVITATCYDGFDGITVLGLNSNSFTGGLFDLSYYMPSLTQLRIQSNAFDDSIPQMPLGLTHIYMNNNEFDSQLPDISSLASLRWFHIYRNDDITGSIDTIPYDLFREYQAFEMNLSDITLTDYSSDLRFFRVQENSMSTTTLETALENMNTFYTSHAPNGDTEIDFTGPFMGYIEDTATNVDYQALDDIWKAEGQTLTFHCNISPGAFANGAAVFTFDDGLKTVLENAEPVFNEYGIDGTAYITIDWIDDVTIYGDSGMTWTEIAELQDSGWVIGSHGCTHVGFGGLNAAELHAQITCIEDSFEIHGFTDSLHFAYPFGNYDQESEDSLQDNKFLSTRIVDDDYYVGTESEPWLLPGVTLENSTSEDFNYYKPYIDFAYDNKVAVIFLSHGVYDDCDEAGNDNCTSIDLLESVIEYIQGLGMDILTIDELYDNIE